MRKEEYYYDLPKELIAQTPIEPRDSSRLLHYIVEQDKIEDKIFKDVIDLLNPGDVLVINNTKVIPARLIGHRENCTGAVEILLLKRINLTDYECIVRPAKRLKVGTIVEFSQELKCEIIEVMEDGIRKVHFIFNGVFEHILDKLGKMPLPPYIQEELKDKTRYNTVYSKVEGSAAAPTAGLHFTNELLKKLEDKGVIIAKILLHVGLGTFRPVKEEQIENHKLHSEYYEISKETADIINKAKDENRRIVCVGTTSVRTLETVASQDGKVKESKGNTEIFIYPPYTFKCVDALITNFHLPESTLIMLVSALIGKEKTMQIYEYAVNSKYRFFSFGDAMFLDKEVNNV